MHNMLAAQGTKGGNKIKNMPMIYVVGQV